MPLIASSPTVPSRTPNRLLISPFVIDFPIIEPISTNAIRWAAKYSGGPSRSVYCAMNATPNIRMRSPPVSPQTEAMEAIFRALPDFPFRTRG